MCFDRTLSKHHFPTPTRIIFMRKIITTILTFAAIIPATCISAATPIKYGDFENWVTRSIKESGIIGGKTKTVYEIGPTQTISGDKPYTNTGGSPWATSNILAKVVGITKTSNAVFPDTRSAGNKCCKLTTIMENCKAIGLIDIDVVVSGSIFLGQMFEPIKSTRNPYSKMEMGIPYTGRPSALQFDYKLYVPADSDRIYSSGFGPKKTIPGSDNAEAFIILQRRWEDADGNLYAKRVGTGRERMNKPTGGWVNSHKVKVLYGDITKDPAYKSYMGLIPEERNYHARNSKGKIVPVREVGWDDADATPTHMLVMFSSGCGEAYVGTVGMTLWIDNVALVE